MNKIILMLCALALSANSKAQTKVEVKSKGSKYSTEQIIQAFESADMCGSFYMNKRNTLKMDDGSIVELRSASELITSGISISDDCILPNNALYYYSIWSVADNGLLLKGSDTERFKSEKEYLREQSNTNSSEQ
jgi:hypothetical protein